MLTVIRRNHLFAALSTIAGDARAFLGGAISGKGAVLSLGLGLAVLLAVYAVLYGAMLVATDFVPYVLDNNESFSSLNHARNLIEFGAAKSFGLADEAVSPHAAAHPYVHTHQGNLPRLFSTLLYLFGARSIEWQIALTTFTVGLGVIAMAYTFFARRVNPVFGLIAGLVLMTDYVFFAQWQVNTYRVWIPFFIFSSLLCAEGLAGPRHKRWLLLTFVNSAFLFYFEFVFVAFTAVMTGLYMGWRLREDWRRLVAGWAVLGLGAITGLGILTLQLIGYLGWQDFLTDARLTFLARNMAENPTAAMGVLQDFYGARNIAFFFNLADGNAFKTWNAFWASFTRYQIEILTPFIAVMAFIALAGAASRGIRARLAERLGARGVHPTVALAALALAIGAVFVFLGEVLFDTSVLGLTAGGTATLTDSVLSAAILTLAGFGILMLAPRLPPATLADALARLAAAGFLLLSALWISIQPGLYHPNREVLWGNALVPPGGLWLDRVAVIAAAAAWTIAILLPPGRGRARGLGGLAPFFVCGLIAYGIAYGLSPGYVHSGYLFRGETFLVAQLDAGVAAAFFLLIGLAREFVARRRALTPALAASGHARFGRRVLSGTLAAGSLASVIMAGQWLYVQGRYVQILPPDQLAFLARFKEPPLKGKSIVSNTYPVPFALTSGSWGYTDQFGLLTGATRQTAGGFEPVQDFRYLWLADRKVNPAYGRPEVYLCFYGPSLDIAAARLANRPLNTCGEAGLVKAALSDEWRPFRHRVVARDRRGTDNWAILALDWTAAPYLKPLETGAAPLYVRGAITAKADGRPRVSVEYAYAQQDGAAETGTVLRLYRVPWTWTSCRVNANTALTPMAEQRGASGFRLPRGFSGAVVVSVTPASAARRGREYFSPVLAVGPRGVGCDGG